MLRKGGIALLLTLFTSLSFGQDTSCAQTLERATEEFNLGHFYDVPQILKPCLDNGFSDEQKVQALYLLTRTFLYLDKLDSADYTFLELLKIDPEYKITEETGHIDVVYLSNNFTTTPIISIKAEGGTNFSTPAVIHENRVEDLGTSQGLYSARWGFGMGVGLELHFTNSLSLEATPSFAFKKYRFQNVLFGEDRLNIVERNILLDVPIAARYTFPGEKYRPYVYAGGVVHGTFQARGSVDFVNVENDIEIPVEGDDTPLIKSRNFTTTSLLFGLGTMYKIGYNYIHLEFQYTPGLLIFNNRDNRYTKDVDRSNPVEDNGHYGADYPFKYPHIDDDFRLNTFKINVGYTIPLYKPRKKGEFTIRSLFEKDEEESNE